MIDRELHRRAKLAADAPDATLENRQVAEVFHTSATLRSSLSTEVVKIDATSFLFFAAEDDAIAVVKNGPRCASSKSLRHQISADRGGSLPTR